MSKRPLRRKLCAWCDQSLEQAAKGHCGAIYAFSRDGCFWVPAIKEHGAEGALALSRAQGSQPAAAKQPAGV